MTHSTSRDRNTTRGQMEIAIRRLAGQYPFHVRILERFDIRQQPAVGTMAVTLAGNRVQLLYNPEFVLQISLDELGGVVLHEVHHVLFGHLLADAARYPDSWARTVAEEITVNEFVKEPLPGNPIRLESFPDFPLMESTAERYHRLEQIADRFPLEMLSILIGNVAVSVSGGLSPSPPQGANGSDANAAGTIPDDHSIWQAKSQDTDQAEATIRALIQDTVIELGIEHVPAWLLPILRHLGIGQAAGSGEYELTGTVRGQLNWVRLLRRYVGRDIAPQPDFTRPPRRFPQLVGIVPGKRRRGGRPLILAVIDTSASLSPDLLEIIGAELTRMATNHAVTLVECDAKIQRVTPFRRLGSLLGRGGTDLRPPFEAKFLRRYRPDLVVYFTDGYGPAPIRPPNIPVIWCLTEDGKAPADWGRVLRMELEPRT